MDHDLYEILLISYGYNILESNFFHSWHITHLLTIIKIIQDAKMPTFQDKFHLYFLKINSRNMLARNIMKRPTLIFNGKTT